MQCMNDFHIEFFRSRQVDTTRWRGEWHFRLQTGEAGKTEFLPSETGLINWRCQAPSRNSETWKDDVKKDAKEKPSYSTVQFVPKLTASSYVSLWGRGFVHCSCLSRIKLVGVDRKWSWTVTLSVRLHSPGETAATRYVVWGVDRQSVGTWWGKKIRAVHNWSTAAYFPMHDLDVIYMQRLLTRILCRCAAQTSTQLVAKPIRGFQFITMRC